MSEQLTEWWPAVPEPFYGSTIFLREQLRCQCGERFSGAARRIRYEEHWILTHGTAPAADYNVRVELRAGDWQLDIWRATTGYFETFDDMPIGLRVWAQLHDCVEHEVGVIGPHYAFGDRLRRVV